MLYTIYCTVLTTAIPVFVKYKYIEYSISIYYILLHPIQQQHTGTVQQQILLHAIFHFAPTATHSLTHCQSVCLNASHTIDTGFSSSSSHTWYFILLILSSSFYSIPFHSILYYHC